MFLRLLAMLKQFIAIHDWRKVHEVLGPLSRAPVSASLLRVTLARVL